MPAINQSFDSLALLSDGLRDVVRRRLREMAGAALIVAAILLTAALASWSVHDPSLSHATVNPVRNLIGLPGAIAADLMMQLLGLGALALVLPIAVWGWRLASHRRLRREWLRVAVWIIGVVLASTFVSCLPPSRAWPLPAGRGGGAGRGAGPSRPWTSSAGSRWRPIWKTMRPRTKTSRRPRRASRGPRRACVDRAAAMRRLRSIS